MDIRSIIEAKKTALQYGNWNVGHIPKSQFPLRKKKFKQSREWHWRLIEFRALSHNFIVLIRLNQKKQQFYSHLCHKRDDGIAVICSHDLHVSHKNWHCHFIKGDVTRVETGYMRDRSNTIVYPSGNPGTQCTIEFDINTGNALKHAAKRFRFPEPAQSEFL